MRIPTHITAYVLRFISDCRTSQESRRQGLCITVEIQKASLIWIRCCQKQAYLDEYLTLMRKQKPTRSLPRMRQLQLYMDENSVMKCRGQMQNVPIPESAKYSIFLPPDEPLTTLIVNEAHEQLLHSGVN